jgi:hypothetical protein
MVPDSVRQAHHGSPRSDRVPLPAWLVLRDRLPPWAAVGPRTLALSAGGFPTRTTHDPRTQVVAGRRQHAPADLHAACRSGRTSAHRLPCRRWGETPTRPVPRRVAACRTRALYELTGADRADTDAMPDACTGQRTPDVGHGLWTSDTDTGIRHQTRGHRTRGHRTGGRWTRAGRRTLDGWTLTEDVDRASKAQWASDIPPAQRRWDAEPCCCGRHARRSATMTLGSEATCQPAGLPAAPAGSRRVAPPAAKRRLGALLSSEKIGVESSARW